MVFSFRVKEKLACAVASFPSSFRLKKAAFLRHKLVLGASLVFTAVLMLIISSFAVPAHVQSSCVHEIRGLSVETYFANEPSSVSPVTIHAVHSVHGASGFFVIPKGESAYFWSTQFTEATTVPEGRLVLDMWAQPTMQGSDGVLSVSAFTTDVNGVLESVLFSGLVTDSFPEESGQVANVFDAAAGSVPASGFIELVLTAPDSSAIKVYWGEGQPSNFQIYFTYS